MTKDIGLGLRKEETIEEASATKTTQTTHNSLLRCSFKSKQRERKCKQFNRLLWS